MSETAEQRHQRWREEKIKCKTAEGRAEVRAAYLADPDLKAPQRVNAWPGSDDDLRQQAQSHRPFDELEEAIPVEWRQFYIATKDAGWT